MANIPFYKAGQLGIVKDTPPEELHPSAWSDGKNIRFEDGKVIRAPGTQHVFGTPLAAPSWVMPVYTPTTVFWVYANLTDLFATDGVTHAEVTRASGGDYATTERLLWNGGILSGIPVITNGVDIPQYWATPSLSNDFANLTNWPSTARCAVIRPYKNFLVAMNIIKSGTQYGQLVKWSAPAVPGAVPPSWDEADPTTLAGEVEIGEDMPGAIQDGLVLRDTFIIYKDNSTWGMQFIGGNSIFRFYPIFTTTGILTQSCVKSIKKGMMHFVATGDDLVVHDGQNVQSVLDRRWKRTLRNQLSATEFDRSYVIVNHRKEEAWFCYPTTQDYPDTALVWNWREDTIAEREIPNRILYMDAGPVAPGGGGGTWDSDSGTWDSDSGVWDTLTFRVHFFSFLGANQSSTEMQEVDADGIQTFDTAQYTAFIERTGLALTGQDRTTGELKADYESRKICTRIWIKASGSPFQVQVGSQEFSEDDPVVYETAQTFTPGTDKYLDFTANGRYLAVKFYSETSGLWTLEGFNLEIEVLGTL